MKYKIGKLELVIMVAAFVIIAAGLVVQSAVAAPPDSKHMVVKVTGVLPDSVQGDNLLRDINIQVKGTPESLAGTESVHVYGASLNSDIRSIMKLKGYIQGNVLYLNGAVISSNSKDLIEMPIEISIDLTATTNNVIVYKAGPTANGGIGYATGSVDVVIK